MEVIAILAGIAFAVNKTVTVIKAVASGDKNLALTQLLVWVIGVGAVILAAHASLTSDMIMPGIERSLGSLDTASLVLLGWVLGSSGSFAFDIKKAIDNGDSAQEPPLLK